MLICQSEIFQCFYRNILSTIVKLPLISTTASALCAGPHTDKLTVRYRRYMLASVLYDDNVDKYKVNGEGTFFAGII